MHHESSFMNIIITNIFSKRVYVIFILSIVFLFYANVNAAEYNGRDIDGESFSCTAFSYNTGKYYYAQVEFYGDEATLFFSNGGRVVLTIDDEEIDDPSSISAFDYKRGAYWDLEVDGLD